MNVDQIALDAATEVIDCIALYAQAQQKAAIQLAIAKAVRRALAESNAATVERFTRLILDAGALVPRVVGGKGGG